MDGTARGSIIDDFILGNTRIKISDAYCHERSGEEVEDIMKHISWRAQHAISAASPPKIR